MHLCIVNASKISIETERIQIQKIRTKILKNLKSPEILKNQTN
jgi:hypothetical protein